MRTIKFRAWDKDEREMFEVYAAGLTKDGQLQEIALYHGDWRDGGFMSGKDFELMQYTGLKDKYGVEIYEGDILTDGKNNYPVQWRDNMGRWECGWSDLKTKPALNPASRKRLEVIGNVYENPELLHKTK